MIAPEEGHIACQIKLITATGYGVKKQRENGCTALRFVHTEKKQMRTDIFL